jgi:hypothetical protein
MLRYFYACKVVKHNYICFVSLRLLGIYFYIIMSMFILRMSYLCWVVAEPRVPSVLSWNHHFERLRSPP